MFNRREMAELSRLALPATFSSLCFALMEVVDTAMLGLVGVGSMAGAALASTVLFLVLALPNNFLRAIAPIAAATYGKAGTQGRVSSLSRLVASVGFMLGSAAALVVIGATLLLPLFGYEPELVVSARTYLIWRAPFLPIEIIFLGGWSLLDGLGKPRLTLITGVATNLANVIFNLLLIPGLWGLPALGVMGAAIATDISVLIGMSMIGVCLYKKGRTQNRFRLREAMVVTRSSRELLLPNRIVGRLVELGWPLGVSGLIEVIGGVVLGLVIARFGQDITAVHGIIGRLIGLGLVAASGIGVATTTLVARAVGQRIETNVRQNVRRSLAAQVLTQTALGILVVVGVDLYGPWLSSDSSVLGRVVSLIPLWLVILWTEGLITVLTSVLEGLGCTRRLLWATIGDLGLLLPGAIILGLEYGLSGFYMAWLIKNIFKIVLLLRYQEVSQGSVMSGISSSRGLVLAPHTPQYLQPRGVVSYFSKPSVQKSRRQAGNPHLYVYRFWPLPIPDG
jgi:Na+-driven multidrug efflux pump